MTDLTVQDLLACFALEDRQALEDVEPTNLGVCSRFGSPTRASF
jgi:hypothetical protein